MNCSEISWEAKESIVNAYLDVARAQSNGTDAWPAVQIFDNCCKAFEAANHERIDPDDPQPDAGPETVALTAAAAQIRNAATAQPDEEYGHDQTLCWLVDMCEIYAPGAADTIKRPEFRALLLLKVEGRSPSSAAAILGMDAQGFADAIDRGIEELFESLPQDWAHPYRTDNPYRSILSNSTWTPAAS